MYLDRPTQISTAPSIIGQTASIRYYEYDAVSNITKISDNEGNTLDLKYSPTGRLVEFVDGDGTILYSDANQKDSSDTSQTAPDIRPEGPFDFIAKIRKWRTDTIEALKATQQKPTYGNSMEVFGMAGIPMFWLSNRDDSGGVEQGARGEPASLFQQPTPQWPTQQTPSWTPPTIQANNGEDFASWQRNQWANEPALTVNTGFLQGAASAIGNIPQPSRPSQAHNGEDFANWPRNEAGTDWAANTVMPSGGVGSNVVGIRGVVTQTSDSRGVVGGLGYSAVSISETTTHDRFTGNIFTWTTTTTNIAGRMEQIDSHTFSVSIPGIKSASGTVGSSSGLQLNSSIGGERFGARADFNVGIAGDEVLNVGASTRALQNGIWSGRGIHVPLNPTSSIRNFSFTEETIGNTTIRLETGAYLNTTIAATAVAVAVAGAALSPAGALSAAIAALLIVPSLDHTLGEYD